MIKGIGSLYDRKWTGYPDITSSDGIYSSYIPRYAVMPGYYSLRLTATDNNGRAQVPKGQTKGEI